MKKTDLLKKLSLTRETLGHLDDRNLVDVAGMTTAPCQATDDTRICSVCTTCQIQTTRTC
jgi:hypothetical protein